MCTRYAKDYLLSVRGISGLTSIEALTPNLGTISKEVSIPLDKRDVEPRLKRMVKRKLLNRSKRTPTDGWRLNDEDLH